MQRIVEEKFSMDNRIRPDRPMQCAGALRWHPGILIFFGIVIGVAAAIFLNSVALADCLNWAYDLRGAKVCVAEDLVNRNPTFSSPPDNGSGNLYFDRHTIITSCTDQFKDLPTLAERLHIEPMSKDAKPGTIVLSMCDGRSYDLLELINAMLDKLDRAAR